MELPSIQDILADVSTAGQEYLDNEAEISNSVKELESLELPEILSEPPKPPSLQAALIKKGKLSKKIKKKKKKHALGSFSILPSDPKTRPALVYKEIDTSALERVFACRRNAVTSKPYQILDAYSSEEEKSLPRANIGGMVTRNIGWREDSLKLLRGKSAKIRENTREKVVHKPKKNILAYMDKIPIRDESVLGGVLDKLPSVAQFDSMEMELFYPEKRLIEAKKDNLRGLKAFSRYYKYNGSATEWCWKPCLVLDYDSLSKKFLLEWEGSFTRKYATRLNILFEGESKELFFQRIESAVISRDYCEEAKKYYQDVMNVKMPPFSPLSRKTKIAIISRIGVPISVDQVSLVASCIKEIENDYDFSMRKAFYELKHGKTDDQSSLKSFRFAENVLTASGAKKHDITQSLTRNVAVATGYMSNANPNVQDSIISILGLIDRLLPPEKRFFMCVCKDLNDAEKMLEKAKSNSECIRSVLIHQWPTEVLKILESYLVDDCINIRNKELSEASKMRIDAFLKLIDTIMGSQVQNLVVEGFQNFLRLFGLELTVSNEGSRKKDSDKFKYHFQSLGIFTTKYRFIIQATIKIYKESGFQVLRDIKNVHFIKIRPENDIVILPGDFEEFKTIINTMLMLPLKTTRHCIPKVRTLVMPDERNVDRNWVKSLDLADPLLESCMSQIEFHFKHIWTEVEKEISSYKKYSFLAKEDLCATLEDNNDLEEFEHVATQILVAKDALSKMKNGLDFCPLFLDCSCMVQALTKMANASIEKITLALGDKIYESCDYLEMAYTQLDAKISADPGQDVQKWKDLSQNHEQSEFEFEDYDVQFSYVNEIWELMYKLKLRMPNSLSEKYWNTYKWPNIIREHMAYCKSRLDDSYHQIIKQIKIDSDYIVSSFAAYKHDVWTMDIPDIEKTDDMNSRVQFLRSRLKKVNVLSESVQSRCSALNIDISFNPSLLNDLFQTFDQLDKLWSTSSDIRSNLQEWSQSLFIDLNADFVISKAVEWTRYITELLTQLHEHSSSKVVHALKVQIDNFSRNTTIIRALRNSALKNYHWDQIAKIIGYSLHDFSGLRLRQVMDLDLEMIQDILLDISDQATREYNIVISLDAVRAEMNNVEFSTEPVGSCLFITDGNNSLEIIENLIIKSQRLLESPDAECLASKINQWIHKLRKAETMLTDLMELQIFYSALLPAFEGFYGLVNESELNSFKWVSKFLENWGEILSKNHKLIILLIKNDIHDGIISAIARLESTKHVISNLANTKRSKIPRFFFLSDLEVLKVITCAKDINTFNKFVYKCFPKIKCIISQNVTMVDPSAKVSFLDSRMKEAQTKKRWAALKVGVALMKPARGIEALSKTKEENNKTPSLPLVEQNDSNKRKSLQITHVEGFFQERFKLDTPVEVNGDIEGWFDLFENGVKKSIFGAVSRLSHGGLFDLEKMLIKYPLQICSLAFSIIMTKKTSSLDQQSNPTHFNQLKAHLSKILQTLIIGLDSDIPLAHRHSYEYFISVIQNYISFLDVLKTNNQERDGIAIWSYAFAESDIEIRAMKWNYIYGLEYFGMDTRLVLLPDWITLYSNLLQNIFYGSASILIGPPGSFKTGLLSELASILGYKCISVDGGPTWSISRLTDILQGALLTQSWVVLKNIDSYNYDLLSLVNNYVTLAKKSFVVQNDTQFIPEDVTINGVKIRLSSQKLQPILATATFSSMESFRTLHERIRLSFRPISTNIPSLDIFAHLTLYASGFKDYLSLSDKFNAVLKSFIAVAGWFNYKIGIRLIIKILKEAKTERMKHLLKVNEEGQALVYSLQKCISPLLSGSELSVLKDILKKSFPEVQLKTRTHADNHWLKKSMLEMNLSFVSSYAEKVDAIFDLLENSQVIITLGNHFSGKTSGIKTLQHAISKARQPFMPPLNLHEYFLGSYSFHELIGQRNFGAWKNGLIATAVTQASTEAEKLAQVIEKIPKKHLDYLNLQVGMNWILFHGDLAPKICDYITNILMNPENRSESQCKVSPLTRLLFEVNDLKSASPSLVTRVPIVHLGSFVEPFHIFQHTIGVSIPSFVEGHGSLLDSIFHHLVFPTLSFVGENGIGLTHDINALIRNMVNLFTSFLHDSGAGSYDQFIIDEQKIFLVSQALLSIVWTFGMVVNRSDYGFDRFCREELFVNGIVELEKLNDRCSFECVKLLPEDGSVFDFFFEPKLWSWKLWDDLVPESNILSKQLVSTDGQIIFTSEIVRYSYFSRVLLEKNHRFVLCGAPGIGKSTLMNACLRDDNFPNFKNKIKCILDSSYNSEKLRRFVLKFYKDNEHELDQSCIQNQRLILFIDDMETITANEDNCNELLTLLKMLDESGRWPAEIPLSHINLAGMAICAAVDMALFKQSESLSKISNIFHYFEMDPSHDRLEAIANSVLHPAITSNLFLKNDYLKISKNIFRATKTFAEKLKGIFSSDTIRSHYSFSMRELVNLFRGLALHVSGDFRFEQLIDIWAYQTELIFLDQLSSQADIQLFRAHLRDRVLELDPNASNMFLLGSKIFIPGIDRDNCVALFNDDGLYHVAPSSQTLDDALFPNLVSDLKEKFGQIEGDKIHRGTIVDSIKISSKLLYNNLNVILVGNNLKNHNEIASLTAHFGDFKLHRLCDDIRYPTEDLRAAWDKILNHIYDQIFKSRQLQVLFLKCQDLESSWQWEDIHCIFNKFIPVSCLGGIRDLKFPSESLSEISKISLCSRMFKIIISMESPNELRRNFALYPFLNKGAIIHWTHPLNAVTGASVTMEILPSSFFSKFEDLLPNVADISEFAISIFKDYIKFPSKTYHVIKQYLPDAYDLYRNTIMFFSKICHKRGPILDNQRKKFQSALSKIEVILQLLDDIELYFYKCRVEYQATLQSVEEFLKKVEVEREAVDKAKKDLDRDKLNIENSEAEIKFCIEKLSAAKSSGIQNYKDRIASYNSINREDLMEVRFNLNNNSDILLGFKIFVSLLNYEYKSGENLIECTRRLLADSKLMALLSAFDPSAVSESLMEKMKSLTQNFDRAYSKTMMVILSWFDDILVFQKEMEAHKPLKAMLELLQSMNDSLLRTADQKKANLLSMESELAILNAEFDRQMKTSEESGGLLREAETEFRASQLIRQFILKYKDRLGDSLIETEREKGFFFYNSMISAAILTYLAPLPQAERVAYLSRWFSLAISLGILAVNPSQYSFTHFMCGTSPSDILVGCDLFPDSFLIDNIHIAKEQVSYPVFYDPYGIAIKWIVGLDRDSRIEVVGSMDEDISQKITLASLKGGRIILRLCGGKITEFLEEFIINSQISGYQVEHDGLFKSIDANFKMYIIVSDNLSSLRRYSWIKKCNLIYCSLDNSTANSLISDHIFTHIYNDKKEEIKKSDAEAASLRNRHDAIINRSADFILMVKKEDLSRGDLYRTMIKTDEMITSIIEKVEILHEHELKRAETVALIWKISWPMAEVFVSLDRLALFSTQYYTSFPWFLDICTMIARQFVSFEGPHLKSLISQLILAVYNYNKHGLTKAELTVWSLELALISFKYALDSPIKNVDEYIEFLGGKNIISSPSVDSSSTHEEHVANGLIPDYALKNWERLSKWQKFKPVVDSITLSMTRFAKNWDLFFTSENPLTLSHLSEFYNLSEIDKLVFVYVLRPDCIHLAVENLLTYTIPSYSNDMPLNLLHYMFRFSNSHNFLWIINNGTDDVVHMIKRLASEKSMTNSISVLSLEDKESISELKNILINCIRLGRWIVINHCHSNASTLLYLDHLVFYLLSSLAERNHSFRLWLVSKPFDHMPHNICQHSIKIRIPQIRSLRSYLNETLSMSFEDNIQGNSKNPASYRRIIFSFLVGISFFKNAGRFQIAGLNSPLDLTDDEVIRGTKLFKSILLDFGHILPDQRELMEHFKQMINTYILKSQSFDYYDKRIITSVFSRFISNSISDLKHHNLTSFLTIQDAYAKSDMKNCADLIKMLPNDDKISPVLYGLDKNAQYQNNVAISEAIMKSFHVYYKFQLEGPFKLMDSSYKELGSLCEYFLSSIQAQCMGCFDWKIIGNTNSKHIEVTSKCLALYSPKPSKFLEHVLLQNIDKYRTLIIIVVKSLERLICTLNGSAPLFNHFEQIISEIKKNQIPSSWILGRKCYLTYLKLDEFIKDFACRLKFINSWYNVRQNPSLVNKGSLIIYDITKMFCPQAFLLGLLLDYSATSRESIESLDFDITILGGKPSSLPEKGAYISGLSLVGASWDFSKGVLKSSNLMECSLSIPCLWVQPVVRLEQKVKNVKGAAVKGKNRTKFECPLYIYKPKPGKSTSPYVDLFIASFYISSIDSDSVWVDKNVHLVCEL